MAEQRNPYKGQSSRAFLRLDFRAPDASRRTLELLVDTGSAEGVMVSRDVYHQLVFAPLRPVVFPSWGFTFRGWFRLAMPSLGLTEWVEGYGNDLIATAAADEHPDFQGLVGLPILRLGEYGGPGHQTAEAVPEQVHRPGRLPEQERLAQRRAYLLPERQQILIVGVDCNQRALARATVAR